MSADCGQQAVSNSRLMLMDSWNCDYFKTHFMLSYGNLNQLCTTTTAKTTF